MSAKGADFVTPSGLSPIDLTNFGRNRWDHGTVQVWRIRPQGAVRGAASPRVREAATKSSDR